jgi:hypothetical protein
MLDVAYVVGSVIFFLLMLRYVDACERLGQRAGEGESHR